MTIKQIKTVPIQLDRERNLGYNFNSVASLEKATGENPFTAEFWQTIGPSKLRALVWAGLLHEDSALTQEQVGEWMAVIDASRFTMAVTMAWDDNNVVAKSEAVDSAPPEPAA